MENKPPNPNRRSPGCTHGCEGYCYSCAQLKDPTPYDGTKLNTPLQWLGWNKKWFLDIIDRPQEEFVWNGDDEHNPGLIHQNKAYRLARFQEDVEYWEEKMLGLAYVSPAAWAELGELRTLIEERITNEDSLA